MGTETKRPLSWESTFSVVLLYKMRHHLMLCSVFIYIVGKVLASGGEVKAVNPMLNGNAFLQSRFR